MKRNDNKFVINVVIAVGTAILFLSSIIVLTIGKTTSIETNASEGDMFVTIESNRYYKVIYDKETMIEYINTGYTVTMLTNVDGTPKLYKGEGGYIR